MSKTPASDGRSSLEFVGELLISAAVGALTEKYSPTISPYVWLGMLWVGIVIYYGVHNRLNKSVAIASSIIIIGFFIGDKIASAGSGRIAFMSRRDGNAEIYVMNEDGSMQTNLTNKPSNDYWPQWSPDGSKIAFHSYEPGQDAGENVSSEIYIIDVRGKTWVRLTNNGAANKFAAWSPDGSRIVYVSDVSGDYEIYVMNSDGDQTERLTNNPAKEYFPMWSPSGQEILFDSDRDGNNEIYLMRSNGSRQVNLTNHSANDSMAAWSPSGDKIAFSSNRSGQSEIWLMNKDGGDLRQLTDMGGQQPRWSSDGGKIVFFSAQDQNQEIYTIRVDGSNLTRLTNSLADDRDPSWSD